MKKLLLTIFLSLPAFLFAQQISFDSRDACPPSYEKLLQSRAEVRADDYLNEELVNLVNVHLIDSMLPCKHQRHRVVGGGFIKIMGWRWKTINFRKEKFVGTAKTPPDIPAKALFTEYDVNWNLVPHLPQHIALATQGYQVQKEIGRKKSKIDYEHAPYLHPGEGEELNEYHLHCENTPLEAYRPMINEKLYPVIQGNSPQRHPSFGQEFPTLGLMGAFISDCNHTCHPEIHPYEWIWWLNVNPNLDEFDNNIVWTFSLQKEGSRRFPRWSPSPRVGKIELPFVFPASAKQLVIDMKSLVFGRFMPEHLDKLSIPTSAQSMDFNTHSIELEDGYSITIKNANPLFEQGVKYWLSNLNFDETKQLISGKLNFGIAVEDIFSAKITMTWLP